MLLTESAPWLLGGFLMAGIIKVFIPTKFLHKHLGGNNTQSIVKGALIGAPLPLCSCSVIPVAMGVHRAGGSKAATTSFLIASPETGVDSISITYALLGPLMTIIRPIAAIITSISTGMMVMFFDRSQADQTNTDTPQKEATSCCSSKNTVTPEPATCCSSTPSPNTQHQGHIVDNEHTEHNKPHSENHDTEDSCCSSNDSAPQQGILHKIKDCIYFSFVSLPKDTAKWLFIGIVISAAMLSWIPESFLAQWGSGPYAYLFMALVGIPMYVCATSSTPIAVGLLFAGVSPGAVLVFLQAGPATNIATLGMVKKELGAKVLVIYLTCLTLMSFLFGWMTDILAGYFMIGFDKQVAQAHTMASSPIYTVSAIILFALMLYHLFGESVKQYLNNKTRK